MTRAQVKLIKVILLVLIILAVGYAIFRPEPPGMWFRHSDKVGHVLGLFSLTLIARWTLTSVSGMWFWPVMVILAGLLEYLQGVLRPLRVASIDDAYANLAGVALAFLIWGIGRFISARRRNR